MNNPVTVADEIWLDSLPIEYQQRIKRMFKAQNGKYVPSNEYYFEKVKVINDAKKSLREEINNCSCCSLCSKHRRIKHEI